MTQTTLFQQLEQTAAACVICERMRDRQAVFSSLNGTLTPKVLFIAEAPGRNGADRTRIPFHGDASGETFAKLLASINLTRAEIFISNTVLCSPRKPSGANDKPTRTEIRNCSDFLRRTIELVNPPIVATLGAVALEEADTRSSKLICCSSKQSESIRYYVCPNQAGDKICRPPH